MHSRHSVFFQFQFVGSWKVKTESLKWKSTETFGLFCQIHFSLCAFLRSEDEKLDCPPLDSGGHWGCLIRGESPVRLSASCRGQCHHQAELQLSLWTASPPQVTMVTLFGSTVLWNLWFGAMSACLSRPELRTCHQAHVLHILSRLIQHFMTRNDDVSCVNFCTVIFLTGFTAKRKLKVGFSKKC